MILIYLRRLGGVPYGFVQVFNSILCHPCLDWGLEIFLLYLSVLGLGILPWSVQFFPPNHHVRSYKMSRICLIAASLTVINLCFFLSSCDMRSLVCIYSTV